jgi:pimeloyl-ACP methyl ester carboxylesterase
MSAITIPLDRLIGDTTDISCTNYEMIFKDLKIAIWKYSCNNSSIDATSKKFPVVAIHGGPACCHNYMLPLKLLAREGYDIIFYDQAGCGKFYFYIILLYKV